MPDECTIVTYHYVRDLKRTRYPEIKGLKTSSFKSQLDYLDKNYQFVTIQDCINAIYQEEPIPENAALLTFDDGYKDHYETVFPILEDKGIQGSFFPPVKAVKEDKVLNVNKIHFVLAATGDKYEDVEGLITEVFDCLDTFRQEYELESNDYYYSELAEEGRFDPEEIVFIKRLLQHELNRTLTSKIIDRLFSEHVTEDEATFSRELYMSEDQIKCMQRNGMYIGVHGYDHRWLGKIPKQQQKKEIDLALNFLDAIGSPTENWVMNYPYGSYNDSVIELIKQKGCKLGLTTDQGIAQLSPQNAFTLERLDTNDLPQ